MIKYLDLKAINNKFNLSNVIKDILDSGYYLFGKKTEEFEKEWARYCKVKYCISCGNGLNALELIIKAFDFPKESEIIVAANTYIATILAISNNGLIPVLVEPKTNYTIDPPNDLLGLSYIKEIIKQDANINIHSIKRTIGYHDEIEIDNFASASLIRNKLLNKEIATLKLSKEIKRN